MRTGAPTQKKSRIQHFVFGLFALVGTLALARCGEGRACVYGDRIECRCGEGRAARAGYRMCDSTGQFTGDCRCEPSSPDVAPGYADASTAP